MMRVCGQYTAFAMMKVMTAVEFAAVTNSVRGAFRLFSSRLSISPQAAIIMIPTAPPK